MMASETEVSPESEFDSCGIWLICAYLAGNVTQVAPSSPRVSWSNVGAVPEANAYNYENEDGYKDPDDPDRYAPV